MGGSRQVNRMDHIGVLAGTLPLHMLQRGLLPIHCQTKLANDETD